MKITDNRNKPIEFKKLIEGQFFEYDSDIWIKYDFDYIPNVPNAMNLCDCSKYTFTPNMMVVPVEVELVINR